MSEAGARLARVVSGAADCLSVPNVGPEDLLTGEPGFHFVGGKSYGRLNTFLLKTGLGHLEAILPLLCRDILEILEATLAQGPVTVLTNGVLIRPETAARLKRLSDASEYSLDLRISLDGVDAAATETSSSGGA